MDIEVLDSPTVIVPQIISILACLCFFYGYAKLAKRTTGRRMILILCLSDFVLHVTLLTITLLYNDYIEGQQPQANAFFYIKIIFNTMLRFSIFWTCYMSLLVYRSLKYKDHLQNPQNEQHLGYTTLFLFIPALGLTLM